MDFKTSRKESRVMPEGKTDVLVDNTCDFYPIFADDLRYIAVEGLPVKNRENLIVDVEILNDTREELLDRALFAMMKQRGNDPIEPEDGVQWAEAIMGDVSPITIVQQVISAVAEEGPGVQAKTETFKTIMPNGAAKENLIFKLELTNAI